MSQPNRAVAPQVAEMCDLHLAPSSVLTLDNGVSLTIINQGDQPITRLSIFYDGGENDFAPHSLPHVLGEAMRDGTKQLSGDKIEDIIDFNGALLSRHPSSHYSGFTLFCLNDRLHQVLDVLQQIILEPSLDAAAVERRKAKIATTMRVDLTKVSYVANQAIAPLLFGQSHPETRHDIPEDVESITAEQIRDCYQQIVGSGHMQAFAAGQIDKRAETEIINFLSRFPEASAPSPIHIEKYQPQGSGRIDVEMPHAVQSAVVMCIPAIDRSHPDYVNLRLAVMGLGGYFGSRLMQNIREELGLTYGISSALCGSYEGGYIRIGAQCDAKYVEEVIKQTQYEMEKLIAEPIAEDELLRLRRYAWSNLATTADSPFTSADYYITERLVGTPPSYFADQLRCIRQLHPQIIQQMAQRYFNMSDMSIATAGPTF